MNISNFVKAGKNMVIELDDEIEYLLDDAAVASIKRGDASARLFRLIDGEPRNFDVKVVEDAVFRKGPVDYLDKQ